MKLYLEEERTVNKEKCIVRVKEVPTLAKAVKDMSTTKKSYFHKCYHDEKNPRPCIRTEIKK